MLKKYFSYLIFACTLAACNINTRDNRYRGFESNLEVNKIAALPASTNVKIKDFTIPVPDSLTFDYNKELKDVRFVKLETLPESKFPTLGKIILSPSRIIIVDFLETKSVYIFDSTGHFVNRISANKGLASKKAMISGFLDVAYDFKKEQIILHDQAKAKSYFFDKDGNFVGASKEYIYFYRLTNLENSDLYVYFNPYGGNEHVPALKGSSLYLGGRDTKVNYTTKSAVPGMIADQDFDININVSLSNSNKHLLFTPEFSDTVYMISDNPVKISPVLTIHYPGPNINAKLRELNKFDITSYLKLYNKNQYYSFKGEVMCNDDSIYYIATYKDQFNGYFYSAKTGNVKGGNLLTSLSNKDSAKLDGFKYPVSTFNDEFVSILTYEDFQLNKFLASTKLASVTRTLKKTDNPVLIFYKFKDF
ncbi:6-bladed beta-propeller [Chitinophaga agri]|uniref:6-bladed beta-propeller n=1 Tax=Chitinophaga agri TaxID=2703787 RepID=A0A6B9ZHN3_9BACT|nr:6-bladed beta-propeller [Chitinophaga agri]QHS61269.1 6-bladed beta-propeller [Chitinophaga agri]